MTTRNNDSTRWTVAPWFYCDIAEGRGMSPVNRAELRGGVAFCNYCQGTAATHRQVLMQDGRMVSFAGEV
jgi:hypothetical protein